MVGYAASTQLRLPHGEECAGQRTALSGTRLEPSGTLGFPQKLTSNADLILGACERIRPHPEEPRALRAAPRRMAAGHVPDGSRRAPGSARALPGALPTMRKGPRSNADFILRG